MPGFCSARRLKISNNPLQHISLYSVEHLGVGLPDGFIGPKNFDSWIALVSIAVIVLATSFLLLIAFNLFKTTRTFISDLGAKKTTSTKKLKAKCFATLTQIRELYEQGALSDDGVYIEVSKALRIYASEKTGIDFRSSTKRDLDGVEGIFTFTETVDALYDAEFIDRKFATEVPSPLEAINLVYMAVKKW